MPRKPKRWGKLLRWLKWRVKRCVLSCKIRIGQYTYTIEATIKDKEVDSVILLYHCQAIVERLYRFRKDDIDDIAPEAVAMDYLRPHLESGYGYDNVEISWKEIENLAIDNSLQEADNE